MNSIIKTIIIFFIIIQTKNKCFGRLTREECTLARDEFDLCGKELLVIGDHGQLFPETIDGVESGHCRIINESLNCVKSYSQNCIKSFSRNVLNSMLNEMKTNLMKRCFEQQFKQQLVSNAKCLNMRLNDLNECMETFILDLESIRNLIQNKNLLKPYSCCKIQTLTQCVNRIVNTCGETAQQLIEDLIKPLNSIICLQNNSILNEIQYKCSELESLDRKTDLTERSLSPLIPLIDILNTLSPIDPCVIAREKVDDCSTRLLVFGDREQRFASTSQQLQRHSCPLLNTTIQCLHSFDSRCVTPRVDQTIHSIIESLISGAKREFNERCGASVSTTATSSSFRVSTCLNRGLDSMHSCYDKYVAELESVRDQTEDKSLQIMYTCCRFHAMQSCVLNNVNKQCVDNNNEAQQYITHLFNNIVRDFLINTCSEYWSGSALCDALDPLDIESDDIGDERGDSTKGKTTKGTKAGQQQKTYSSYAQSFVRPLIDMFIVSTNE